jgi:hypothetical protein
MRPAAALRVCAAVAVVGAGGCAVSVDGAFDSVGFAPTATAAAILDAHVVLEREGALIPAERPLSDRRVHLWLSGASVPVDEDWRFLDDARLLDVKKDLATHDLLVLRDLPFDALADGERVVATSLDDAPPFFFAVQHGDVDNAAAEAGLGGTVTVEVEPDVVDADTVSGTFAAKVFVKRERAIGQPAGNVATGEVVLTVSLPFVRERLGEANLAFVAPIAACGAVQGPGNSGACATVAREEIVDAGGRQ